MEKEEVVALFDKQAESYDTQWSRLSAINGAMYLLVDALLSGLPSEANILCVGAGTGAEIVYLAKRFPKWRFTAVEPSSHMLGVFRIKAEESGILSRCRLHAGYVDSVPVGESFDAATAFLVSQFILDRSERTEFFRAIASRLRSEGLLISSDLAGDLNAGEFEDLLEVWFKVMSDGGVSDEGIARMREAYAKDVAVLPASEVGEIIQQGGFDAPARFYQAGLIHAWFARRSVNELGY